jgi:hypothetical protein
LDLSAVRGIDETEYVLDAVSEALLNVAHVEEKGDVSQTLRQLDAVFDRRSRATSPQVEDSEKKAA